MVKKLVIECDDFATEEIEIALKAMDYKIVIEDFLNHLRGKIKYAEVENPTYEEVRDELLTLLRERDIYV